MANFISMVNQKLGGISGFDFLGLGLQPFALACIYVGVICLVVAVIIIIAVKAGSKGKYKPALLKKWAKTMPNPEVLLDFWQAIPQADQDKIGEMAKANHWLPAYLGQVGKNEAAYQVFLLLWQFMGDEQADLLKTLVDELASLQTEQSLAACGLLKEIQDDRVIPLLLVALLQNAKFSPARVCDVLAVFGIVSGKALGALYYKVTTEQKPLVLDALGLLKDYCPISVLSSAIGEPNLEIRKKVASVIALVQPDGVVEFISPLLQDSEGKVRAAAAAALSEIGGEEVLLTLQNLAQQDQDWQVKTTCQTFISRWYETIKSNVELDEADLWLKDRDNYGRAN